MDMFTKYLCLGFMFLEYCSFYFFYENRNRVFRFNFCSYFTPDTYANQHSATAARLAAGLCFDLAAAIWYGRAKNGFALVRKH